MVHMLILLVMYFVMFLLIPSKQASEAITFSSSKLPS